MQKKSAKKTAPVTGAQLVRKALRLHDAIARDIGVLILSGHYRPGHVLEGEVEASEQRNVSRTAYREAVRILAAKGLVATRTRVGTRVIPVEQWHLLDPDVLNWAFSGEPKPEVLHGLFEVRGVVEPAVAALAAVRRNETDLDNMRLALEAMAEHTLNQPEGRSADRDFHAALLSATANPFMISLTNGVTAAVDALTEFKLRIAPLKRDPVPDHWRVFDAVAAKDADASREAMIELIRLAILDMPSGQRPKPPKTPRAANATYF
jgi:DNA-binding FadR family transcriptional regulator